MYGPITDKVNHHKPIGSMFVTWLGGMGDPISASITVPTWLLAAEPTGMAFGAAVGTLATYYPAIGVCRKYILPEAPPEGTPEELLEHGERLMGLKEEGDDLETQTLNLTLTLLRGRV